MGFLNTEFSKTPSQTIDPNDQLPPIPEKSIDGWKDIEVDDQDPRHQETLVPVGPFSRFNNCDVSGVYFGERGEEPEEINFLGQPVDRDASLITHFVREGVLERLKKAQESLPEGYYFLFYDNFRPLDVQQALYDTQKETFKKEHPEWDAERLEEETQRFVSIPAPNEENGTTHPSPHSTGGVVDLTIIKMNKEGQKALQELEQDKLSGNLAFPISKSEKKDLKTVESWIKKQMWSKEKEDYVLRNWLEEYRYAKQKAKIFKLYTTPLNMGTPFDDFSTNAKTTYYENLAMEKELLPEEREILQNRRFLYSVMKNVGFENYPDEWWHYSNGDNMWAVLSNNEKAYYGGFPNLPEYCRQVEVMRRSVYSQQIEDFSNSEYELFTNKKANDPIAI